MPDRGAVLMVLGAALLWGTTGTARALGPDDASPLAVGAVRIAIGGAVLVAIALARGVLARRWPVVPTLLAAAAVAAYQLAFFEGVARAGVAVGTVVAIGSSPVFAGLLGVLAFRERLTPTWIAATALAVAGVALLALPDARPDVSALTVVLPLCAGLAYAVYASASKRLLETHDSVAVAAVAFGGGAVLLAPVLVFADLRWLARPSGTAIALELGILATAVAYLLYTRALRRLPVSRAATLSLGEPLTAAVLGLAVLHERVTPLQAIGAVAVAAGLVLLAARLRS